MKKLLLMADPPQTWKVYKDTSYALALEAQRRHWQVFWCSSQALVSKPNGIEVRAQKLWLLQSANDKGEWFSLEVPEKFQVSTFQLVLMRKDPPFDLEYLYATHLLERVEATGVSVVNAARGLRNVPEKLSILNFPELTAPTLVSSDMDVLREQIIEWKDAIIKPLDAMGGQGVFRIRSETTPDVNLNALLEVSTANATKCIMAQRYLPAIVEGDKRVLVLHGKVFPYCLARIPQNAETRANLAAGGLARAQKISADDVRIAEAVSPWLLQQGILLAGLDVIGDKLSEINVTSPTGFREIAAQTAHDPAKTFWDGLA